MYYISNKKKFDRSISVLSYVWIVLWSTFILGGETISIALSANLVCDLMATLLAIFCLFDVILDKNRKAHPKDEKTDWYFNNKDYDEELKKRDSRDDTNEYKYY